MRTLYGYLQSTVSLVVNASLFSSKLFIASLLASVAVLTDAFNQLGDVGISLMILIAFRFAGKEADREHPYGHGRLEQVVALLVAAALVFVAVLLLLESFQELSNPSVKGTLPLAIVLGLLAAVKEALARFSFAIARRTDSDAIRGDAWNHRYDALLTGAIALAIFLASWREALRVLDPIFGIFVAGLILYTGGRLIASAGDRLLGRAPGKALVQRITELASAHDGVKRVHSVSVHDYGLHKAISLTVDVDDRLSVEESHRIATDVEAIIKAEMKADATVHVEPVTPLLTSSLIHAVEEVALEEDRVHSILGVEPDLDGSVHVKVSLPGEVTLEEADALVKRLSSKLEDEVGRRVKVLTLPCEPGCEGCRGKTSEPEEGP